MIARYQIYGDIGLAQTLKALEEVHVVTVRSARRVEDVAGNDDEINLVVYRGVNDASVCFHDCALKAFRPCR